MGEFKNFINTSGKSLQEIKKSVNDLVNRIAENDDSASEIFVSGDIRTEDDFAEETNVDIHSEQTQSENQHSCYTAEPISYCTSHSTADNKRKSDFSYITGEYKGQPAQLPVPNPIVYPHEPVPDNLSADDEYMLNKIREMRALEEITHNSYIVRACAEITMVRQGEFMADIEDDYGRRVFCGIPQPLYAAMSNSQLRTYFSWRTDVRRGVYTDIDEPYPVLYCYELLNRIGVTGAEDAFRRLSDIWNNVHFSPKRRNRFRRWLKDFYAFNRISSPLPFEDEVQSESDFCAITEIREGNYSDKLDFLADNSVYEINKSAFLDEKNRVIVNKVLERVLEVLAEHFKKYGIELSSLICGKFKKDFSWEPFSRAIVDIERQDGFREVRISAMERYSLKRGEPALEHFELSVCRGFVGYILKSIEAKLRRLTSYGKYLNPSAKMMESDFKNREKVEAAINAPEFSSLISDTVEDYCTGAGIIKKKTSAKKSTLKPWDEPPLPKPIVVTFDESKLDEIRRLADENTRKLIVDEQSEPEFDIYFPLSENTVFQNGIAQDDADFEELAKQVHDDEFDESVADYSQFAPEQEDTQPELYFENGTLEELEPEWRQLALSLTPDNILFLQKMLVGEERDYCRQRNIMPQLMVEEINMAALENIDDVIIEGGAVLEDYAEEVKFIADAFRVNRL